jgi:DNA-binding IclR family transcriptional regulator
MPIDDYPLINDANLVGKGEDTASKLNSTEKVLMILKVFLPDNHPRGTLALCNELDMKPATVSRILSILKEHRFVEQNADRKYQLGDIAAAMGRATSESRTARLIAITRPHLMRLKGILNENIQLELLRENNVKIALVIPGTKVVRVHLTAKPGVRVGVNATAGAKAILAFLTPERLGKIIKACPELQGFQPNTITDWNELKKQLKQIRKAGLAYDFNEYLEDVCAVGTPVFDYADEVIGAVTVCVPFLRSAIISKQTTIELLKKTAENITENLRDLVP